jgi:hypothetical protein
VIAVFLGGNMLDINQLAERGAAVIWSGFEQYQIELRWIMRRAQARLSSATGPACRAMR